jgi:hypothetical protein
VNARDDEDASRVRSEAAFLEERADVGERHAATLKSGAGSLPVAGLWEGEIAAQVGLTANALVEDVNAMSDAAREAVAVLRSYASRLDAVAAAERAIAPLQHELLALTPLIRAIVEASATEAERLSQRKAKDRASILRSKITAQSAHIADDRAAAETVFVAGMAAATRQLAVRARRSVSVSSGKPGAHSNHFTLTDTVGPDGLVSALSMYGLAGSTGFQTGGIRAGPLYAKDRTSYFTGADGGGASSLTMGPSGVDSELRLEGRAGAGGSAGGQVGVDGVGELGGRASGFAGAQGDLHDVFKVDAQHVDIGGDFSGLAGATGTVGVDAVVAGTKSSLDVTGFAGAKADADAGIDVGPTSNGAHFGFSALAGASVSATQSYSGEGFSVGATATGYAGAGLELSKNGYEASYKKVSLNLDVGAALGLGFGLSANVSVSPKYFVDQFASTFGL